MSTSTESRAGFCPEAKAKSLAELVCKVLAKESRSLKDSVPHKESELEELRQQARCALLSAVESGDLLRVFAEMAKKNDSQDNFDEVEQLRLLARDTLLKAAESGSLERALQQQLLSKEPADSVSESNSEDEDSAFELVKASEPNNFVFSSDESFTDSISEISSLEMVEAVADSISEISSLEMVEVSHYSIGTPCDSPRGETDSESSRTEEIEELRADLRSCLMKAAMTGELGKILHEAKLLRQESFAPCRVSEGEEAEKLSEGICSPCGCTGLCKHFGGLRLPDGFGCLDLEVFGNWCRAHIISRDCMAIASSPRSPPASLMAWPHAPEPDGDIVIVVDRTVARAYPFVQLAQSLMARREVTIVLERTELAKDFKDCGLLICTEDVEKALRLLNPSTILYTFAIRVQMRRYEQKCGVPTVLVSFRELEVDMEYPPRPALRVCSWEDSVVAAEVVDGFAKRFVDNGLWQRLQVSGKSAK